MGPDDLFALRNFFTKNESKLPGAVASMYGRLFAELPDARGLFKGNFDEQQAHYRRMLQAAVCLTRSNHLWPVRASSGKASLPILDKLGIIHADVGVTRSHFELMKSLLAQCCQEMDAEGFTPGVEAGLAFIFDVVASSLVKTADVNEAELARKNSFPFRGGEQADGDWDRFINGEAWDASLLPLAG